MHSITHNYANVKAHNELVFWRVQKKSAFPLTNEFAGSLRYPLWLVESNPSCETAGYRSRYCLICDKTEYEEIPAYGHDFGEWKTYRPATCSEEGQQYRTCARCGREEWRALERLPHSFGEWKTESAATCVKEGTRTRRCSVCGLEDRQITERLPHAWGAPKVVKQPTCSEEGLQVQTCASCGTESKTAIAKLPHDFKETIVKEATDHSAGIRTNECSVCGYREEEVAFDPEGTLRRGDQGEEVRELQKLLAEQDYLAPDGADGIFGGGTEKAVQAFQDAIGLEADGVAWPQTRRKLVHEFGEWKVVKPLTRDEDGERSRKCSECGYERHEVVKAEPTLKKGDRSEAVRLAQQALSSLGCDAGSYDGIYGPMLDSAFAKFAKEAGIEAKEGTILPSGIDALVNAWIADATKSSQMIETDIDTAANLVLTVTKVDDESDGEIAEYAWSLTNAGDEDCAFFALLVKFGDDPDFSKGNFVAALGGDLLKANAENSVSGTFYADAKWGEGAMNVTALGTSLSGQGLWLSNEEAF